MNEVKILFLPAAPRNLPYLRTQDEFMGIELNIQRSPRMKITNSGDIRLTDLISHLLSDNPYVAHFGAHGNREGIYLLDDDGMSQRVSKDFLIGVFREIKPTSNIRLVFFNACDSIEYAEEIAKIIGCSIGVRGKIGDSDAIKFATMFYRNIAFGLTIENAFNLSLMDTWPNTLPKIGLPQLFVGDGFDANQINPVQQLFKGNVLFAYPILWNSYASAMNFAKQIHHTFQTLDVQYLNTFIRELDKIIETGIMGKIADFQARWGGYTAAYDVLMEDYTGLAKLANESFKQLSDQDGFTLWQMFTELYEKYYRSITVDIEGYRADHDEASKLIMNRSFIRIREERQEAVIQVSGLLNKARNLTVNSDNLLRKLIGVLLTV